MASGRQNVENIGRETDVRTNTKLPLCQGNTVEHMTSCTYVSLVLHFGDRVATPGLNAVTPVEEGTEAACICKGEGLRPRSAGKRLKIMEKQWFLLANGT